MRELTLFFKKKPRFIREMTIFFLKSLVSYVN
jgi:hypothetical protein